MVFLGSSYKIKYSDINKEDLKFLNGVIIYWDRLDRLLNNYRWNRNMFYIFYDFVFR